MKARVLKEGIYWVGEIDPDRKLFEEITPLPDGTSYNSYLIKGEKKTALIDTIEPAFAGNLLERLQSLGIEKLDYIVSNHSEQDHSGSIPMVLEKYPEAKVLLTPRAVEMLTDLVDVDREKLQTVEDGEEVDLGGRRLRFIHAPWLHWPETMFTYLPDDAALFPCDLFGSHIATNDIFVADERRVYEAAKRYYSEVMMPFAKHVRRGMEKIADLDIQMIGPSHGPVYQNPEFIMEAYRDWASETPKNLAVIPFISTHGSTKKIVNSLIEELVARGVRVEFFNLAEIDMGRLSMALVDAATVIFGSSNILGGMHPKVVYAAYLANAVRPKAKFVSIVGSYGWSARMEKQLADLVGHLKVQMLEPVIAKGRPGDDDMLGLARLAEQVAELHARETSDWKETSNLTSIIS